MDVSAESDPDLRAAACSEILASLPNWFGQPASNAAYARDIRLHTTLLARMDGPVGLIALRPHFDTTLEVWLVAVHRTHHRQGIGRRLMAAAIDLAGPRMLAVSTLSPRSPDPGYAATRAFYSAMGFRPFVDVDGGDPRNPMMWMLRPSRPSG